MESILSQAIKSVEQSELAFCKFLSPNDTKITDSHQAGFLLGKSSWPMFWNEVPVKGANLKVDVTVKWQADFETKSKVTYYGAAKNELRLTQLGRGFPFREADNAGDLFVLTRIASGYLEAFLLQTDEEIEDFFVAVGITALNTNMLIPKNNDIDAENILINCFRAYVDTASEGFPSTADLAYNARKCYIESIEGNYKRLLYNSPDNEILKWLEAEFQLFKIFENSRYSAIITKPFSTVEELINTANTILNRRKSRAGKSLEHHLAEVFSHFNLRYTTQSKTEDFKKPDFLFPGEDDYHNPSFDERKLIVLAAKTTCKDRWRQILNEADRVKEKHLFTLQQGISANQLVEMYHHGVRLVVPEPNLNKFPVKFQPDILTLNQFVHQVRSTQER